MFEQARSFQVVWFSDIENKSPMELFKKLIGQDPDSFQKLSPPQAPFPVVQQSLVLNGVQHRLQSHVGRIDYYVDLIQDSPDIARHFDNPQKTLSEIINRVIAASEAVGTINRAAIVTILANQYDSDNEVASRFSEIFPGNTDFSGDRDLIFQVSRPLLSPNGQPLLNRLLRWASENVTFQQFMNAPGATVQLRSTETHFLTYMVDVNSVVTSGSTYAPAEHGPLFGRLLDVSTQLFGARSIEDIQ